MDKECFGMIHFSMMVHMKASLTLCPLVLFATGFLEASDLEIIQLQERVTALEQKTITPPTHYRMECEERFFFAFEPLFWKATEEGLTYAITGSFDLLSQGNTFYKLNLENGRSHQPKFGWHWGFKMGIGYEIPHDGWDLFADWTRYIHSASDRVSRDGDTNINHFTATGGTGQFVSPFWVAQLFASPGLLNVGEARWNLHLDLIDLELGREFLISRFLSLRPFIGLRNGWIDQKYNLFFLGFDFEVSPTTLGRQINVDMENKFWGIGCRGGLNTQWFLGKGFSVYGNGAFSFLDGRFKVRYKLHDLKPTTTTTVVGSGLSIILNEVSLPFDDTFENSTHEHTDLAMADLELGIRWERSFNGWYYFAIWGGYEQNIFFEQNQFMNFQNDFTLVGDILTNPQGSSSGPNYFTDRGNLVTQGFTGGFQIGF